MVPLLDSIAPIRAARGRPRHRPGKLHADKAYDIRALCAEIRRRGIGVRIARKGVESSQRPGRHRWIVEACLSWLMNNRVWSGRATATPCDAAPRRWRHPTTSWPIWTACAGRRYVPHRRRDRGRARPRPGRVGIADRRRRIDAASGHRARRGRRMRVAVRV
jgi:hypothetical protein